MDRCQPITIKLQSGDKVYVLLIENEDILKSGDSECYCYGCTHFVGGGTFFISPDATLDDAIKRVSAISPIISIYPTQGFNEFFDDQYLSKYNN